MNKINWLPFVVFIGAACMLSGCLIGVGECDKNPNVHWTALICFLIISLGSFALGYNSKKSDNDNN